MTLSSGKKKRHDFYMTLLFLKVHGHDELEQTHDFQHVFFMCEFHHLQVHEITLAN